MKNGISKCAKLIRERGIVFDGVLLEATTYKNRDGFNIIVENVRTHDKYVFCKETKPIMADMFDCINETRKEMRKDVNRKK